MEENPLKNSVSGSGPGLYSVDMSAYAVFTPHNNETSSVNLRNPEVVSTSKEYNGLMTDGAATCHVLCAVAHNNENILAKALFHIDGASDTEYINEMIELLKSKVSSDQDDCSINLYLYGGKSNSKQARQDIIETIDELHSEDSNLHFEDRPHTEIDNLLFDSDKNSLNENILETMLAIEKPKIKIWKAKFKENEKEEPKELKEFSEHLDSCPQPDKLGKEYLHQLGELWEDLNDCLHANKYDSINSNSLDIDEDDGGRVYYACSDMQTEIRMDNKGIDVLQQKYDLENQKFEPTLIESIPYSTLFKQNQINQTIPRPSPSQSNAKEDDPAFGSAWSGGTTGWNSQGNKRKREKKENSYNQDNNGESTEKPKEQSKEESPEKDTSSGQKKQRNDTPDSQNVDTNSRNSNLPSPFSSYGQTPTNTRKN